MKYLDTYRIIISGWRQGNCLFDDSRNSTIDINHYRNNDYCGPTVSFGDYLYLEPLSLSVENIRFYIYGGCHGLAYHLRNNLVTQINKLRYGRYETGIVFKHNSTSIHKIIYRVANSKLFACNRFFPDGSIQKYIKYSDDYTAFTVYRWRNDKTPKTLVRLKNGVIKIFDRVPHQRITHTPIIEYHWNQRGCQRYIKKYDRNWSGRTILDKIIRLN